SGKYQYRLKMVDNDGSFSYSTVEAAEVAIPKDFSVSQNYPNPFNPTTKIDYQVPVDSKVIMEVYNIAGQKVMELVNQQMSAGYYTVNFGSTKLSSGIYIYRLAASDIATGKSFSSIKKMMLLK
ncbi:MAG: T9SS type A sorting domain-containing protein, partial [Ignavibacteriaceae bacterium]|nr:T9SS type A sorting domain-containing protein [Ignavibacteriaceae bacterium]